MASLSNFEISSTDGDTTVNVDTIMGINYPFATPLGFPFFTETASGEVIEHGFATCTWRFSALTETQWDAWRTILPKKSTTVWIRTLREDKFDWIYLTGICIWPSPDEIERPTSPIYTTGEFILTFRNLVAYTPTPP
jgi:hypothetical protein